MKGDIMLENSDELRLRIQVVAAQAIRRYAQDILTIDELTEQIFQEWQRTCGVSEHPSQQLLTRLAQRLCSYALYAAWRSGQLEMRNNVFANLRHYLQLILRNSGYAARLQQYVYADE